MFIWTMKTFSIVYVPLAFRMHHRIRLLASLLKKYVQMPGSYLPQKIALILVRDKLLLAFKKNCLNLGMLKNLHQML